MTRDQIETIRRAIRPLDCGHHYCRYCDAGTKNQWQHWPHCPYQQSQRDVEEARKILDVLAGGDPPSLEEKKETGEPCGHGWHWGAKCDEPVKPEAGPMRDAESLSGVQALGSSGLALAIKGITELRDSAKRVEESSGYDDLRWLWRGKAIAYETVLGRLTRVLVDPPLQAQEQKIER